MKKLLAVLAAASLILSSFAGCSLTGGKDEPTTDKADPDVSVSDVAEPDGDNNNGSNTGSSSFLSLSGTKIASVGEKTVNFSKGGYYYKTNDGYGIISFSGVDSGAVYSYCDSKGKYFEISKAPDLDVSEAANFNVFGLVDGSGKSLVPAEYSFIQVLSDRYAAAYKASGFTSNVDKVLFYLTYDNNKYNFKGEWTIFDLSKGTAVAGAKGKTELKYTAYGDVIRYKTDDGIQHTLNGKGQTLSNDVTVLENGSYYNRNEGDMISVFDCNGNKLFDLDKEEFSGIYSDGDYYRLSQHTDDGNSTYCFLDKSGKTVSAEFEKTIELKGNFIFSDDKLYKFDGEQVIDGDFDSVSANDYGYVLLTDNKDHILIDKYGKVVAKFNDADSSTDPYAFTFSKKIGDEKYVYSFKDKDFIKGESYTFGTAKVTDGDNVKVINTFTGATLIEGYQYIYSPSEYDGTFYATAKDADYNGYIYSIK